MIPSLSRKHEVNKKLSELYKIMTTVNCVDSSFIGSTLSAHAEKLIKRAQQDYEPTVIVDLRQLAVNLRSKKATLQELFGHPWMNNWSRGTRNCARGPILIPPERARGSIPSPSNSKATAKCLTDKRKWLVNIARSLQASGGHCFVCHEPNSQIRCTNCLSELCSSELCSMCLCTCATKQFPRSELVAVVMHAFKDMGARLSNLLQMERERVQLEVDDEFLRSWLQTVCWSPQTHDTKFADCHQWSSTMLSDSEYDEYYESDGPPPLLSSSSSESDDESDSEKEELVAVLSDGPPPLLSSSSSESDDESDSEYEELVTRSSLAALSCGPPGLLSSSSDDESDSEKEKPEVEYFDSRSGDFDRIYSDWVLMLASGRAGETWLLDSGATRHLCNDRKLLRDIHRTAAVNLRVADGQCYQIDEFGTVCLESSHGKMTLVGVGYAPMLKACLVSTSSLDEQGCVLLQRDGKVEIMNSSGAKVAIAIRKNNLFVVDTDSGAQAMIASAAPANELYLWHMRLGYASKQRIMALKKVSDGVDFKETKMPFCKTCAISTSDRKAFPSASKNRAATANYLIHSDVCGPMRTLGTGGKRYFILFICDATRFVSIYFLRAKSEAMAKFQEF